MAGVYIYKHFRWLYLCKICTKINELSFCYIILIICSSSFLLIKFRAEL
jgi:hypothetical protein